jgi:hypothetical protein
MLNMAQISVGYWGPNLLRNIVANKRCQITRVVDLSSNRRDRERSVKNQTCCFRDLGMA